MRTRWLSLLLGTILGFSLAGATAQLALSWGLLPNRELNRSTDYLKEVLRLVHDNYVEPTDASYEKLTKESLHGMLGSLDPHSEFLEAKDFTELDDEMRGDYGGVGIQIETRDNRILVLTPMADSPAERAGVRRGDEIVAVEGVRIGTELPVDQVVDRMRGKAGTQVSLTLHRKNPDQDIELTIVRERIQVKSVRAVRMLEQGIAYIQLSEFSERTGDEFEAALEKLQAEGMRSLILDLRNNPGGLLDAAVWVAEPFYANGETVVYIQGRKASDREDLVSRIDGQPLKLPVVVLINAGSASASEIVAGSLKDTGKAVIVGERSFGKGSVQTLYQLRNGDGLRLTTGRYHTPAGTLIHGVGVAPDVAVVMTPAEDEDLRLQAYRSDLETPEEYRARYGHLPVVDRQLEAAMAVLKGAEILKGRGLGK